jgi:aconitate hydratase
MPALNLSQQLIKSHLLSGEMKPGSEIGLKIDHVLQQDATGTLIMLELEALDLEKTQAEVAVQYIDHNLLQTDFKNMDDHAFLQLAAKKFGYWYSRSGNGISHVVHQERFGVPGKTLLGSDSHTPAGGGIGMLAIGTGGLDVALASAGEPYYVEMPRIMGIELTGKLPPWVSAKDVVLEMLRRYDVKGGRGFILEYYGPGLDHLSPWDRHVIANMGTELGATTSVFPSDRQTRDFLRSQGRENDWVELKAEPGCEYDAYEQIDLSQVEPLIALPSSPGNVHPVREVAGKPVAQVVVGSSANPGLRDFWVVSEMVKDHFIAPSTSFDINPTSRQILQNLSAMGALNPLFDAGARLHQSGCMGCIGMGQAPASGTISLRTMPRNFQGRSGTLDDQVYLCSPETAAAAALTGEITDPRELEKKLGLSYPQWKEPETVKINTQMLQPPSENGVELKKGPNVKSLPDFPPLADELEVPILLKMGDNISTDDILKAGAEVLPLRSNIPAISRYTYVVLDENFFERAQAHPAEKGGFCVVAGENYAQGSSREHAALAPRYLGQQCTLAKSYARIGWQNLVNFGILPFEFADKADCDKLSQGEVLHMTGLRQAIKNDEDVIATVKGDGRKIRLTYHLSPRQREVVLQGGMINYMREKVG